MFKQTIGTTIFFLLVIFTAVPTHAEHKGPPHRQILLLSSYHQTMTWSSEIVQAVEDELAPVENDLVLHIEHMDTKRHHSQPYLDALYRAYKTKYNNIHFDLILASDNHAFDFLRQHRDELFPGVPVVFCGVNDFQDEQITSLDDFTGVAEVFASDATLEIALKNHPGTKQVFIINDHLKTGIAWKRAIQQQLEPFDSRVKLTYSENLSIDELGQQIALLDEGTIVLLGVYFADRDEHYVTYEHMGKVLVSSSNVPVYCLLDFNIKEGVVGGNVIGGYYQGQAMATIAQRILQGELANSIPVLKEGANRYVFDAKQLKRFKIEISDLPQESILINQLPPVFQVSKAALWAFYGVLLFVSTFVIALYLELRKRRKAELAYRESEVRFRDIAMSMGDFIWEVDIRGVYQFCSEKIFDLLGYTPEEILDKTPYDLMTPDQAKIAKKFMKEHIAGRKPFRDFENWNVHKNGELVCLLTSGTPIISDDGSYVGYRGVDRDITAEKNAATEIAKRKAEFEAIVNSLGDAIVFADQERHIVMINPAFSDMFGYQFEEVAGHTTQIIYADSENYLKLGKERFNNNIIDNQPIFVNEYRRKDGTIFTGETISSLVVDENGEFLGYLGVIRDVTDRKQAEGKLAYQKGLLEKSQELGKIGTWVFDVSQQVCQGTDETNQIFGILTKAGIEYEMFLNLVHPEDKEYVIQKWDSMLKGHATDLEYRIVHDNTIKNIREKVELQFNDDGDVVKVIGASQDITEMKILQEKAIRSAQLASVGELAAMVAHEVNNPLSGVIGYAQVFSNKVCDDCPNKELPALIIKEGDRIAKIVGGLLTLSYDSNGQRTLQDIDPIVFDALTLMSYQFKKNDICLEMELTDNLPRIECNAQQIEQVILNIVRNAYQALLEGTLNGGVDKIVKVGTKYIEIDSQGFVQIVIANNGPNIPKELLAKVQQPFFTTKSAGSGTGLGLSISNDIMKNHDGRLEIKSEPGGFTEFVLSIPVEECNQIGTP